MNRKLTAALLVLAAVLANLAFAALGSIFNYPDVLDEPAGQVLAVPRRPGRGQRLVRRPRAGGRAARAGRDRRRSPLVARAMRIAVPVGIAAAVVQVIGLLRWPILVPGYASDARAPESRPPRLVHRERHPRHGHRRDARLSADATWTVLVIVALGRRYAGRWFAGARRGGAVLVLVGVLSPLDLPVSTPRTSSATCSGACGWSPSRW